MRTRRDAIAGAAAVVLLASCRPSDVLNVPPPANQFGTGTPQNAHDAEIAYYGAATTFFRVRDGTVGLLYYTGLLTDEFGSSNGALGPDARYTGAPLNTTEEGDVPLENLYNARSSLLIAENALRRYEPDSGQYKVGEAFALSGYIELAMAESYCAGMTLSYVPDGGGIVYGQPLTTDSLLGVAETHFDSALTHAQGSARVQGLASVGLGRARLDRAHYAEAATAVSAVPTGFVFNTELAHDGSGAGFDGNIVNIYTEAADLANGSSCSPFNISEREGTNGLNFRSANDRRLVLDSTVAKTCAALYGEPDSLVYYPMKFGYPATGSIPLATGVEARLIEAEAALAANDVGTWASRLNALRSAAPSTYLALASPMDGLTADSTTGASADMQVDVMFREREFWLFGTGTRLGDLRRMIRQYHRDARTVFPTGPYPFNDPNVSTFFANYGPDVNLTLPTGQTPNVTSTNPYYRGCLSSPATA